MGIWLVFVLVLLAVAAGISVAQRAVAMALLCAGLALYVLPAAWAYLH
jgi:hypothetical protein